VYGFADPPPVAGCGAWPCTVIARQVTAAVQGLRGLELYKVPGVSETLDWARALVALDRQMLDADAAERTLGTVLKSKDDIDAVRGEHLAGILARVIK